MPKNIVVFSDGTGQDGGVRPEQRLSNVYKLYRACRVGSQNNIDPSQQVAFYDAGLGTDVGATAMSAPVRFVEKLLGSVIGRGITKNIADCYEFIITHYQSGDRIHLIGFSRGAYTVRCLANLIMLCGVPTKTPAGQLPLLRSDIRDIAKEAVETVFEHGAGHPRAKFEAERFELARRFRERYGSNHEDGEDGRSNVAPHFIGVFDTVAALGASGTRWLLIVVGLALGAAVGASLVAAIPAAVIAELLHLTVGWPFWNCALSIVALAVAIASGSLVYSHLRSSLKIIRDFPNKGDLRWHFAGWKGKNFDRLLSKYVCYARAANAIDEKRADFDRVGWGGVQDDAPMSVDGHTRLVQMWFAGNHSDVGGSYDDTESRLSDISLEWMVQQATRVPGGLIVAGQKAPGDTSDIPNLRLFPAADGMQHCEVAAMQDTIAGRLPKWLLKIWTPPTWAVKVREIKHDAPVHPSVKERFKLASVVNAAGSGPYRPKALENHDDFKNYYGGDTVSSAVPSESAPLKEGVP
ncbi:uncharacterized protein (DUF2235 family) [Rhodoblastus acidophilus]|uniref:DUF2235 domain-containing protein n=1 Tax=Rhodoblastus acidophilus TaxID=1074 RepID=UPI002224CF50|nr:DUF2235 domain-containing protein [Rhodoblastus acidophilus]MCW2282576.1 uncharacterized protein (DUF2235 family) [Rhodoblastus acidophilus]MCW2331437.1 uncharacterized protein (DUF2235 family) [Rhodoblastus acidophilus]